MAQYDIAPYHKCSVCQHPDHLIYEAKIVSREITQTKAAQAMGVDGAAVSRHMRTCVPKRMGALTKPEPVETVMNVVNAITEQYEIVKEQLQCAIEGGKIPEIAVMLKEARKHIELYGKFTGQLTGPTNQINLMMNPDFQVLKQNIFSSLDPIERNKLSERLLKMADAADTLETIESIDEVLE